MAKGPIAISDDHTDATQHSQKLSSFGAELLQVGSAIPLQTDASSVNSKTDFVNQEAKH